MSLEHMQKIMGSVNDLTQMCPLLKSHQRSGNAFMATFGGNRDALRVVPAKLRKDLETVAKVAEDTKFGMPIAEIISQPGLSALTFYTDAAGASFTFAGGKRSGQHWRLWYGGHMGLVKAILAGQFANQSEGREGLLFWL